MQATLSLSRRPTPPSTSNMSRQDYMAAVDHVKEYIQAGDIFQLVLSHRFKRRTFADPFEVYRSVATCTIARALHSHIHNLRPYTFARLSQLDAPACRRLWCIVCRSPTAPGNRHVIGACNRNSYARRLGACHAR